MIQRYEISEHISGGIFVEEDDFGEWVSFLDHQQEIEALEYELRYLREQNMELHEEISSVLQHSGECC